MTSDEFAPYWASARASIESTLMPLARKTRCLPQGATFESVRLRIPKFDRDDPKREVVDSIALLSLLCAKGDVLVQLRSKLAHTLKEHEAAIALVDETLKGSHEELVSLCDHLRLQLAGYLAAINATNAFRVSRGAKVRRTQGNATRDRVKSVARRYTHLSRESAAVQIAEEIGKSSGTVRRLLSELFPGDQWHKSTDLTQRSN